jgi:hypothetical protein
VLGCFQVLQIGIRVLFGKSRFRGRLNLKEVHLGHRVEVVGAEAEAYRGAAHRANLHQRGEVAGGALEVAEGGNRINEKEADAIVKYAKGHGTFDGAPFINHQSLSTKGFIPEELNKLDAAVESAFDIAFVFNHYTLGEECLQRIGYTPEQYMNPSFSLLEEMGFKPEEINAANDYVCGTMMLEGAPYLKPEHLPVFDCANKCGKHGERFIHHTGHIRMMGATQPFISGAISKTINLPHEATVEEIADSYLLSWKLGLKANAIYRDGSKLSQPLSTKSDKKTKTDSAEVAVEETTTSQMVDLSNLTVDELLEEVQNRMTTSTDTVLKRQLSRIVERKSLPAKRRGFTQKARIGGQVLFLRTGEYNDGTVGELFIDLAKEGSTLRSLMNCFAISISVGLGEVELAHKLSMIQELDFKYKVKQDGYDLIIDSKSQLSERIKAVIIQMIHYSEEHIKTNFSVYLSEKTNLNYTYLSNVFRAENGITIQQFIIIHKI